MDKLSELRSQLDTLKTEVTALSEKDELSPEEETRFEAALGEFTTAKDAYEAAEQRAAAVAAVQNGRWAEGHDAPSQINRSGLPRAAEVRNMNRGEVRQAAIRVAEARGKHLSAAQQADLERKINTRNQNFDGDVVGRMLVISETDEYHSAFMKGMSGNNIFTPEEGNAVLEMRAANEGTGSAGGFGIPILIDPTIILTSGAAAAPILDICTVTTITTDQWKGVNSAGMSWHYYAEAAVVSDDTATLAQPTIPVYRASGFLPYTLEVGDDYPGFQEEMSKLLAQGYLNLVAPTTATGSGSSQPTGIFTGLQNQTNSPSHVTVTTKGTLGAVDVRTAWQNLPERFRPNATWFMNVSVENSIRAFGNNLALADYTINLTADGLGRLTGRPVVLSDYAPSPTNTTGAESFLVVGDFSHYRFIQRAGMVVELVPHLFDTSTGRPLGERGWFAYARHGADADAYNAFRLVSNT